MQRTCGVQNHLLLSVRLIFCECALPTRWAWRLWNLVRSAPPTQENRECFDFFVAVNQTAARTHVVRNDGVPVLVQAVAPPRRRSDVLAEAPPGFSVAFSASGWLFIYQLGVAECLQNHRVTRNPHVRCAGASGGALTAMTMIYGGDMPVMREQIKESAHLVHANVSEGMNLRIFVLKAMKTVIKDGSYKHPVFQSL